MVLPGQLLPHPVDGREGVFGRDVIPVRRKPAKIGRALLDQRQPPVREVRGDLDPDARHELLTYPNEDAHVLQRDGRRPAGHRDRFRLGCILGTPIRAVASALSRVRDLGRLGTVVARMGHEVLQDHLLDVTVLGLDPGQCAQRLDALLG